MVLCFMEGGGGGGGGGAGGRLPLSRICHTSPTVMRLSTVIPYLTKFQKYVSRDRPLEFC